VKCVLDKVLFSSCWSFNNFLLFDTTAIW